MAPRAAKTGKETNGVRACAQIGTLISREMPAASPPSAAGRSTPGRAAVCGRWRAPRGCVRGALGLRRVAPAAARLVRKRPGPGLELQKPNEPAARCHGRGEGAVPARLPPAFLCPLPPAPASAAGFPPDLSPASRAKGRGWGLREGTCGFMAPRSLGRTAAASVTPACVSYGPGLARCCGNMKVPPRPQCSHPFCPFPFNRPTLLCPL